MALIEERGYSGFSVDDIPRRANLSIGTVYRYYPGGKRDILREIIARNNQALIEMIALDDSSEGTLDDLWRRVIVGYLRGHVEGRFSLTALEYSFGADAQFKEVLGPIVAEFLQELAGRISRLRAFPALSERELFERVILVFGIIGLLVKSHVKRPIFKTDEQLVEYLVEISRITFEMRP